MTATDFTHLGNYDARPNGTKRLTECGVFVRREACVRIETATCPECRAIIARRDAELADAAAAVGMVLVDGFLVSAEDAR